jgi:hypothetical protein
MSTAIAKMIDGLKNDEDAHALFAELSKALTSAITCMCIDDVVRVLQTMKALCGSKWRSDLEDKFASINEILGRVFGDALKTAKTSLSVAESRLTMDRDDAKLLANVAKAKDIIGTINNYLEPPHKVATASSNSSSSASVC